MRKERKHFTAEEKVATLRRHPVDKVAVSELCEELGLRPTVFYRWQKELFENGDAAFARRCKTPDPTVCGPLLTTSGCTAPSAM
jgi:transposase